MAGGAAVGGTVAGGSVVGGTIVVVVVAVVGRGATVILPSMFGWMEQW